MVRNASVVDRKTVMNILRVITAHKIIGSEYIMCFRFNLVQSLFTVL